ncbi:hypothetical protein ES703_45389 [subsurface metagenome]
MFVRIKKSGKYQYLQVVENRRSFRTLQQRIIGSMGRLDLYKKNDNLQHVIASLNKLQVKISTVQKIRRSPKKRVHKKPSSRRTHLPL